MFETVFPSIIRGTKLHIQHQVFARPILLPAASHQYCYLLLAWMAISRYQYWSDKCLTLHVQFCAPDDGRKNRLKHVERLTEINKL